MARGTARRDRVDALYRSDRLFSALTLAMQRLGYLNDWLNATARSAEPAASFGSLFPYQGDTLLAIPPATLWPPPSTQVTAPNAVFLSKIRWKAARFVPLNVIDTLATGGGILAEQWLPDSESGCLLRRDRPSSSPFRVVQRSYAAVDRLAQSANSVTSSACVEFEAGAGLWTAVRYRRRGSRNGVERTCGIGFPPACRQRLRRPADQRLGTGTRARVSEGRLAQGLFAEAGTVKRQRIRRWARDTRKLAFLAAFSLFPITERSGRLD